MKGCVLLGLFLGVAVAIPVSEDEQVHSQNGRRGLRSLSLQIQEGPQFGPFRVEQHHQQRSDQQLRFSPHSDFGRSIHSQAQQQYHARSQADDDNGADSDVADVAHLAAVLARSNAAVPNSIDHAAHLAAALVGAHAARSVSGAHKTFSNGDLRSATNSVAQAAAATAAAEAQIVSDLVSEVQRSGGSVEDVQAIVDNLVDIARQQKIIAAVSKLEQYQRQGSSRQQRVGKGGQIEPLHRQALLEEFFSARRHQQALQNLAKRSWLRGSEVDSEYQNLLNQATAVARSNQKGWAKLYQQAQRSSSNLDEVASPPIARQQAQQRHLQAVYLARSHNNQNFEDAENYSNVGRSDQDVVNVEDVARQEREGLNIDVEDDNANVDRQNHQHFLRTYDGGDRNDAYDEGFSQ